MASLPYMPLFIGDYLADTLALTTEQHGAYLLLLMAYWKNGPLPDDDTRLAAMCKLTPDAWACSKHALASLFDVRDGRWVNGRQDRERKLAAEKKEKSSAKSKAAADARWSKQAASNAPSNAPSIPQAVHKECPSSSSSSSLEKKEGDSPPYALPSDRAAPAEPPRFPPPVPKPKAKPRVYQADLEEAYSAYPRKRAKDDAAKAYQRLMASGEIGAEDFLAIVLRFAEYHRRRATPDDRIPYMATFINSGDWRSSEEWERELASQAQGNPNDRTARLVQSFDRLNQRIAEHEANPLRIGIDPDDTFPR